jgi:Txe/YoeB family toxin of toxin-antitoxin system
MRLCFTPHGWDDDRYWQSADQATLKRLNRLLDDVLRDPLSGIGKPEPLCWRPDWLNTFWHECSVLARRGWLVTV